MAFLALLIGLALPALAGWLTLDVLEGSECVLRRAEKWVLGWLLGLTLVMFAMFVLHVFAGVPIVLWGFLLAHAILIVPLGIARYARHGHRKDPPALAPAQPPSKYWKIALWGITGWTLLQIAALGLLLVSTPSFFDDTLDNWNLRGKIFYIDKSLTLLFPWSTDMPGVSSYPPTVPLSKTWLATLAGEWNEALINSIHAFWFFAALLILFWILRRSLSKGWAALGSLILAGLPLYMIQGMNTYADVFLSAHLLVATGFLFLALQQSTHHATWLRLSALAIALLPFTKNEGWALYFPVMLMLWSSAIAYLMWTKRMSLRDAIHTALIGIMMMAAICGPWIGWKILEDLPFGNAKGIDTDFRWHPGVVESIFTNTFFEANWIFLFPLLIGLLLVRIKQVVMTPLLVLACAFLMPYGVQLFAYLFTGLAQEAIFQTGYARGVLHLAPLMVMLTVLLLHDLITGRSPT